MQSARNIELTTYCLLLVGAIFIFNSSGIHSQSIFGNPYRFFILHISWMAVGLIFYKIFTKIRLSALLSVAGPIYFISLFLLFILAIAGVLPCSFSSAFTPCINSANRWFVLNPAPLPAIPFIGELSFQPSELAKFSIILFLSVKLAKYGKTNLKSALKSFLVYTGAYSLLILLEPNMSTALMVLCLGLIIYVASGASIKPIIALVPIVIVLALFFALASPYRRERILTYVNKSSVTSSTDEGYHVRQVKIALGSGGFFGVGFGASRQKYTFLPEVATDSIFAVIGEEFGFIGTLLVTGLFLFFLKNGFDIAKNQTNPQLGLLAIGVTGWISLQFLIHLLANSGLIPYTGVPLPLISYGGSSMLFNLIAIGVLVNIGRQN